MKKQLCQKLDEKQVQVIVGGMTKSQLVDSVAAPTKISKVTLAFMESLTIYG